jgi:hypothetical protein
VDNTLSPVPGAIRFSNIQQIVQQSTLQNEPIDACITCHQSAGTKSTPVFYTQGGIDVDYETIRGRINFADIVASPLLRKPSGKHHGAGNVPRPGFDASLPPGHSDRVNYDVFLNWILNGAPR